MANKCRDCVHVEADTIGGLRIRRCTKGHWDPDEMPQWYAESTVLGNRPPIRQYGADCPEFKARGASQET